MSINKFIKNYKKPTKSYFEFKKDKEKIFENFEVELEKENTKKFKAKRLKITLSLILLLILSIGAIIIFLLQLNQLDILDIIFTYI